MNTRGCIWYNHVTESFYHISKPILLTHSTTNARDVSRTNIYRANSPTIYARVMNLQIIAYIVKLNLWESFHYIYIYIFNHATHNKYEMHERQTLKNKPILRIKPFPLNPLNFSPIDNKYQNGWRNWETNMGRVPPQSVHFS
jgi:hypothetical protein